MIERQVVHKEGSIAPNVGTRFANRIPAAAGQTENLRCTPARVSVVIPVYNRASAVLKAIGSVLAQTFQDFEIIVIDDGSTDASAQAVAAIRDRRLRLITHDRNRGGSAARNTGIQASSAPYIAFLDSDDEWLPRKLEEQLRVFAQLGESVGLVYTGAQRLYPDGSARAHVPERRNDLARTLMTVNVIGETSVGMVRRRVLDAVGGFDETLPSSQDLDLWVRISERFLVGCVSEPLVRVSKSDDRNRITTNIPAKLRGRELFCQKHQHKMRVHGVLHEYLRTTGWVHQRASRDLLAARRLYLESLTAKSLAPMTYVLLVSTYVPVTVLDRLAQWKHGLISLLQHVYRARVRIHRRHISRTTECRNSVHK